MKLPQGAGDAEPPIACTLGAADIPERVRHWQDVAGLAARREPLVDGIRLSFVPGADIGGVVELCQAEQECCAFFRFAVTVDARGTALEVRAPAEALPIVQAMFGAPT